MTDTVSGGWSPGCCRSTFTSSTYTASEPFACTLIASICAFGPRSFTFGGSNVTVPENCIALGDSRTVASRSTTLSTFTRTSGGCDSVIVTPACRNSGRLWAADTTSTSSAPNPREPTSSCSPGCASSCFPTRSTASRGPRSVRFTDICWSPSANSVDRFDTVDCSEIGIPFTV